MSHPTAVNRLSALGWTCLATAGALLFAWLAAPNISARISASQITPDSGESYLSRIDRTESPLYRVLGDGPARSTLSSLVLLEDGYPLGPATSSHDQIRKSGGGAYSHWERHLYFSSSDGSDPRSNGREYSYRARAELHPRLLGSCVLLGLAGLFLLGRSRASAARTDHGSGAKRRARRAGTALSAAALGCLALLTVAPWLPQIGSVRLPVQDFTGSRGHAYAGVLPGSSRWPWTLAQPSRLSALDREPRLLENSRSIGWLSANPIDVWQEGEGRFVYFDRAIFISTTDGSDPRVNGRRYELEAPVEPERSAWLAALGLLASGLALLLYGRARLPAALAGQLITPSVIATGPPWRKGLWIDSLILLAFLLGATSLLVANWLSGHSGNLGVASYLPVSDALGYLRCAVAVDAPEALRATGFADWCGRRALYPAMLSSLLAVSGGRASVVLLLQASMLGLGCGVIFLALRDSFGWVTALVAASVAMAGAASYGIGSFMTESLGFAAGLAGFALLLDHVRRDAASPWLLAGGLALMSFAQFVRPGGLLSLPLLAVWVVYVTRDMSWPLRVRVLLPALAALGAGPVLQYWLVTALGADPASTGSNSAALLYGLSTGSRDWAEAYRVFAHLFETIPESAAFQHIRDAALANIRERPEVFLGSLWAAGAGFARSPFGAGLLGSSAVVLLYWVGFVLCVLRVHRVICGLLLALALGELLSAPFVIDAGEHRVLVATLPARATLVGLGAAWLVALARQARVPAFVGVARPGPETGLVARAGAVLLAAALGLAAVASAALSPAENREQGLPPSGLCSAGQHEIVVRSPGDLMQLTLGERRLPWAGEVLGIPVDGLRRDPVSRGAWWLAHVPPLPAGTTFILAVQRARGEEGIVFPAISSAPLPGFADDFVSLCLAKPGPDAVQLGDWRFRPIASWHRR